MSADIQARPAGQPRPRIDLRAGDDRPFRIDCTLLLREHELMTQVTDAAAPQLGACRARTRQGRAVEVQLAGVAVPAGGPHLDTVLRVRATTTRGAVDIVVDVRVHAA
jgi:hypothetical protein